MFEGVDAHCGKLALLFNVKSTFSDLGRSTSLIHGSVELRVVSM